MATVMLHLKLLTAKHSPRNGCFCEDGELLYIEPPKSWPSVEQSHVFTGVVSNKKSKFGWVTEVDDSSQLNELLQSKRIIKVNHDKHLDLQGNMLKQIEKLENGIPVAVDFVNRGIPPKITMSVHRVIFYHPDDTI